MCAALIRDSVGGMLKLLTIAGRALALNAITVPASAAPVWIGVSVPAVPVRSASNVRR